MAGTLQQAGLRYGASLIALLLYGVFIALRLHAPLAYQALLLGWDAMPNARPYGDLDSILRAGACWREGVNVYAPSVCMHGGVYNYSPFLLRAADFGLGPADRVGGGLLLGALFLAACSVLPAPESGAEFLVRVLGICSGMVIYALESGNFDSVVFMMSVLGVALLLGNGWARLAGYAVFLLAAACKFYPVALLGLMPRERLAVLAGVAALVAVAGVVFLLRFGHGSATAISILPGGLPFRCVFGAMNLPFGLVLLRYLPVLTLEPHVPQFFAAVGRPGVAAFVVLATKMLTVVGLLAGYMLAPRYEAGLAALDERRRVFFVAGALVIVFCFFAVQNLDYRGVFLLLLLPGLWQMRRRGLVVLVLLLMWEAFFRDGVAEMGVALLGPARAVYPEIMFWLIRESLWWCVVIQLTSCIFLFLRGHLARWTSAMAATPRALV